MLEVNEKLFFLYNERIRFKSADGGRNGGKSHDFATCALMRGFEEKPTIVCLREFQKNLAESVHRLLSNKIQEDEAFKDFYTVQKQNIYGKNGTEFAFSGIRNAVNFKSFEGADIAWVEEAQTISQSSLDILIPTIRKPGSEIWFSFNPYDEKDPIYQFTAVNPRKNLKRQIINYLDNPNCPPEMIEEANYCKQFDYDKYEHIWLGKPLKMSDAVVFKGKFHVEDFDLQIYYGQEFFKEQRFIYKHGLDFGFSIDPTAAIQCFTHDGNLYIINELYVYHCETDDIIPRLKEAMPAILKHKVFADSSRPDTISQLSRVRTHRDGYPLEALNIEGAIKGKGSIMDGIEFLRNFKKIIIHPRCKNTIFEFSNYKYKQDPKTGEIFRDLEDKHNHIIDALRYAWNTEIQALRASPVTGMAVNAVDKLFR